MFYLSSFIICATDESNTEEAMTTVPDEAEEHGWELTIPPVRNWISHNYPEFEFGGYFSWN